MRLVNPPFSSFVTFECSLVHFQSPRVKIYYTLRIYWMSALMNMLFSFLFQSCAKRRRFSGPSRAHSSGWVTRGYPWADHYLLSASNLKHAHITCICTIVDFMSKEGTVCTGGGTNPGPRYFVADLIRSCFGDTSMAALWATTVKNMYILSVNNSDVICICNIVILDLTLTLIT